MQIQPSLYSYEKAPRSQVYDRRSVALEQDDASALARRDDAMTGSQTVLSNSLAEALWAIQRSATEDEAASGASMESLYLSYSE